MREATLQAKEAAVTLKDFADLAESITIDEKADYPWDDCIADQMKKYGDKATAEKVCGAIRARNAGKELSEAEYKEIEAELGIKAQVKALSIFKQADGRLRIVGVASNNYRDRDNPPEIITEAAHKEFMAYLDANPDRAPEFWHWHTRGTKYAKADGWEYSDGMTIYTGLVDIGKEKEAMAAAESGDVGMSHGFFPLGYDKAHNLITKYRTFEVSDLPKSRAANPFTSFNVVKKEAGMAFSEAKKSYFTDKLGVPAATVAEWEKMTSDLKSAADAAGADWKDFEDEPAAKATGDPDEAKKPEPKKDENADAMEAKIAAEVEKRMAAMGKSLEDVVGKKMVEVLKPVIGRMDAVEASAKEAAVRAEQAEQATYKTIDEHVAELIGAKPLRKGFKPSAAASTRVDTSTKEQSAAKAVDEPTLKGKPADTWDVVEVALKQMQMA